MPVKIQGKTKYALLDTRAEVNLITLDLVEEIGLSIYIRKPSYITYTIGFTSEEGRFVRVIKDILINITRV